MLIEIWLVLFALAAFLIFLGYQYDAELTLMVGYAFVFLLGLPFIWGGIDFVDGDTTNTTFTYVNNTSLQINQTVEVRTESYENYSNRTMGLVLAVIGGLGFANVLYNSRKNQ